MTYLLIFLGACMVIGPVLWMQPSPAQKRKAKFREVAISRGLQVNLVELPRLEKRYGEKATEFNGVAYRLPWRREDKARAAELGGWLCIKSDQPDGSSVPALWEWKENQEADEKVQGFLIPLLTQLSTKINAIECNAQTLSVYWEEKGELEDVESISALLESVRSGA